MMKTSLMTQPDHLTMESLALPKDLLWDGKMEPSSPPTSELFPITESTGNWFDDNNFTNGITLVADNGAELKSELLQLPQDLLNCVDFVVDLCELKDHWNGGKLQLDPEPIDYPIESVIANPISITKVQNPFDANGCNLAGLNAAVFTQLTPPHSPPQNGNTTSALFTASPAEVHVNYKELQTQLHSATIHHQPSVPAVSVHLNDSDTILTTPSNTNNTYFTWGVDQVVDANVELNPTQVPELNDEKMSEMIDEFVNKRANELSQWIEQCSDASSCSALSTTTEEEWMHDSSAISSAGSTPTHQHFAVIDEERTAQDDVSGTINKIAGAKKRTRPYGRGVEDRKIRKKEQNKNAATRYRHKKKLEMEVVLTEEQQLEQHNDELKRTLADCKREAKYLRQLIREFYSKTA